MPDTITPGEKKLKVVGTRPVRPDGVPKVTGLARFGADYSLPGMLWGKILRSPHAHARIRSIDTSQALALPGVKAVMTAADLPEQKFEYVGAERVAVNFWHMTRGIMAREKALFEGHAVAAVAAISKTVADEALRLIKVDYEVLPHVINIEQAMQPDAPLLFEDMITRGVEPAPDKPSNISKRIELRSAISRQASPRPTRSWKIPSGPRRCIKAISSPRHASRASTRTDRRSSGRRVRGTSLFAH
ncbi:MAG: hypothetical protein Q8L40_02365 [Burkholderiales bacterium]|nr:hypothetical protein [Burkholderiales bacterium]